MTTNFCKLSLLLYFLSTVCHADPLISGSGNYQCAADHGNLLCFDRHIQHRFVAGRVSHLSVGRSRACAVIDDELQCWKTFEFPFSTKIEKYPFKNITYLHLTGDLINLVSDEGVQTIDPLYDRALQTPELFKSPNYLYSELGFACAVAQGEVGCWGHEKSISGTLSVFNKTLKGQFPQVEKIAIDTSPLKTVCGILDDDSLRCINYWTANDPKHRVDLGAQPGVKKLALSDGVLCFLGSSFRCLKIVQKDFGFLTYEELLLPKDLVGNVTDFSVGERGLICAYAGGPRCWFTSAPEVRVGLPAKIEAPESKVEVLEKVSLESLKARLLGTWRYELKTADTRLQTAFTFTDAGVDKGIAVEYSGSCASNYESFRGSVREALQWVSENTGEIMRSSLTFNLSSVRVAPRYSCRNMLNLSSYQTEKTCYFKFLSLQSIELKCTDERWVLHK